MSSKHSTTTTPSTAISILEDWNLFYIPLPIPLGMKSIGIHAERYCSNLVNIPKVIAFEKKFNDFMIQMIKDYLPTTQFQLQSLMGNVTTTTSTNENGKQHQSGIISSILSKIVPGKASENNEGGNKSSSNKSDVSLPTILPKAAIDQFVSKKLPIELGKFRHAYSLLQEWQHLVNSLASLGNRLMLTCIFSSAWKSGFTGMDYTDTCIRYHTIMFGVMVAAMSFNLGRQSEMFGMKGIKDYYIQSFRILDGIVENEISAWTILSLDQNTRIGVVPEISMACCTALKRLCLMKLQHSAITVYDHLMVSEFKNDKMATALKEDVDENDEENESTVDDRLLDEDGNISMFGISIRETAMKDSAKTTMLVQMSLLLKAQYDGFSIREYAEEKSLHDFTFKAQFPNFRNTIGAAGLHFNLSQSLNLGTTMNYLDQFSSIHTFKAAALFFQIMRDDTATNSFSDEMSYHQYHQFCLEKLISTIAKLRDSFNPITYPHLKHMYVDVLLPWAINKLRQTQNYRSTNDQSDDKTPTSKRLVTMTLQNFLTIFITFIGQPRSMLDLKIIDNKLFKQQLFQNCKLEANHFLIMNQ